MRSNACPLLKVGLSVLVDIRGFAPIESSPLRLVLKQSHSLYVVVVISRKPVVDARRQDEQVVFLKPDPNPIVALRSDIEVTCAVPNVSDLFVFVQVFVKEHLHLRLVDLAHGLWGDCNLISVPVVALFCQYIDGIETRVLRVEDANRSKSRFRDRTTRVVG